MISALVIASHFIELGIEQDKPVTPMKLQKLIYLAHGIHLARFDAPLIDEDIEAWSYGPVIRTVYDAFKAWGNRPITEPPEIELRIGGKIFQSHLDILTDDEKDTIKLAWDIGGDLSGPELSNWSHSMGSPWQKTYTSGGNKKIKRDLLKEYFRDTMKIEA